MKYGKDKIIPHPYLKDVRCVEVKVKCKCPCHDKDAMIMHFMPCCYKGYTLDYKIIED